MRATARAADRWYRRLVAVIERVGRVIRRAPWTVAAVATAVFVAAVFWRSPLAVVLLVGYAVVNSLGVTWYCDRLGDRRRPLQLALRGLAVALVPVGLVTTLLTPRGPSPSEASSVGSRDEGVRKAAASTAHGSHHGPGGMP